MCNNEKKPMSDDEILQSIGIDTNVLFNRFCGQNALAYKFLKKFPGDENFTGLTKAVADRDYQQVEMTAHTLKGVCANLELKELAALAAKIVADVREERYDDIDADFAPAAAEYKRVCDALKKLD